MLLNGLYSITFKAGSEGPIGSGVVVLHNGVLLGGDDALLYTGSYQHSEGRFQATVRTSRHTENRPSLFGLDKSTMSFAGKVVRDGATAFGASTEAPSVTLEVSLKFRAPS